MIRTELWRQDRRHSGELHFVCSPELSFALSVSMFLGVGIPRVSHKIGEN